MDDPGDQNLNQNVEDEIQRELSESDSASCNSISNPYYDGPRRQDSSLTEGDGGDVYFSRGGQGTSRGGVHRSPIKNKEMIILSLDLGYFKTCIGFLRTVQLVSVCVCVCACVCVCECVCEREREYAHACACV